MRLDAAGRTDGSAPAQRRMFRDDREWSPPRSRCSPHPVRPGARSGPSVPTRPRRARRVRRAAKSASRQSLRSASGRSHHANCAPCAACAIALPADISVSGAIHSTGCPSAGRSGGCASVSSVPETWSRARSRGQSSTGTGGKTRTVAVPLVTVMPGSAAARLHSAPRARRTTLRIELSSHSRTGSAHSPSPAARSSARRKRTERAAVSKASVRAGGSSRSTRTTSGSAYFCTSFTHLSLPVPANVNRMGLDQLS